MLTQGYLKSLLHYDPDTGVFTWLVRKTNRLQIGAAAGRTYCTTGGMSYRTIKIDGRNWLVHQLVFLYMTGSIPDGEIDHWDTDGTNNRWSNLRIATKSQNAANRRTPRSNTSGIKGVGWDKRLGKWKARIGFEGANIYLGLFDTKEEASVAYAAKAKELFGEFVRVEQ